MNAAPLRLDVGCGAKPRPGHRGVDLRPLPGVHYCCNAWELEQHLAPGSVESIHGRHFFEHLSFAQGARTLHAFRRLLRAHGRLLLIVPDIRFHMQQFLHATATSVSIANPRWTERRHAIAGFWGWQRDGATELWDVHKSGYDEALLSQALAEAGFVEVARLRDKPWNLALAAAAP